MSALGLQIVSYKVMVVMTAFVATAAASVAYIWPNDASQRNGQSNGALGQMEASESPRNVAHSSDASGADDGNSRPALPSKSIASKIVQPSNVAMELQNDSTVSSR